MVQTRLQRNLPAHWRQAYFLGRPVRTEVDWSNIRIRGQGKLSSCALLKLEWIIFYHTMGKKNATRTALQFGIARKTFHKWLKRYQKEDLLGLEEDSRVPIHVRKRQITILQRVRLKSLRTQFPKQGKMKLVILYKKIYGEQISSWKIQKIIEEGHLYPDRVKASKLRSRQVQARIHKRQRITKLKKEGKINYLWHVDTVILTLSSGGYRYLLTAIDEISKLAYARLYTTHSSRNARDFLQRLVYLTEKRVVNIHHDNGSEFKKEFEQACKQLQIPQWYSRPHTPQDNSVLERFNRTIQEEFVELEDVDPLFPEEFNHKLLDFLIHYNSVRPHQALDYQTPLEYIDTNLLPMSSSHTPD